MTPSIKPKPVSNPYGSDDGGMTWHDLGQDIESQGYSITSYAVAGDAIVASSYQVPAYDCPSTGTALWRSIGGGTTWSMLSLPVSNFGLVLQPFTEKASGPGAYGVALAYATPTSAVILYSSDSGTSWTQILFATGLSVSPGSNIRVAVTPTGAVLLFTEDHGTIVLCTLSAPAQAPCGRATHHHSQIIRRRVRPL